MVSAYCKSDSCFQPIVLRCGMEILSLSHEVGESCGNNVYSLVAIA
jgi:hypothetical protein